jgi:hypothetical protein
MGMVGGVTGQMLRHVTPATGFIVIVIVIKKETSDMSRVKRTLCVGCCVAVCVYVCVCV